MSTLSRYPIFQEAYLVNDIDESIKKWNALFGAGPFIRVPHHKTDTFDYRGTNHEADVTYAFGYLGDMMIQFIQQHDDTPSIYLDMFPDRSEGQHHIARLVADYEGTRDSILADGHDLACELEANGIHACYLDTRSAIGVFTELHSITDRILTTFGRWRDAHRDRTDPDDILRHHESGT